MEPLLEQTVADIQAQFPDWDGNEGNLEVVLAVSLLLHIAELRDVASDVPDDILRTIGTVLHGIPAIDAASASVDTTWTVVDNAGYTVPVGTEIGVALSGSETLAFRVTEDLVIPNGDTEGTVAVEAVEAGTAGNDLTGSATLLNPLYDWVDSIVLDDPTSGGVDAESNEDYLVRLVARLQLLTPRPILARDFAVLATDVAGVGRSAAFDNYEPGDNEIQRVTSSLVAGTFTLTHTLGAGGTTTDTAIPWNATAAQVQAALEATPGIDPGDIVVTLVTPDAQWDVEFTGKYAETDIPVMTDNSASVDVGTVQASSAPSVVERKVTVAVADEDGETLSSLIKDEVEDLLEAEREQNFEVVVTDPAYSEVGVDTTVVVLPGYDTAAVEAAVEAALGAYLSPATWGQAIGGDAATPAAWTNTTTVRYLEIASVINAASGVDYVDSLEIAKEGETLDTVDIELTGIAPLPRTGTISVTATA